LNNIIETEALMQLGAKYEDKSDDQK
jgi:hypothetical protein